ncbi:MAG: glutathione peroxidase [Dysgonamonadaceae bacterium]|jgi:glutathione peroxidase|nr:glutathione peroxidase [Dysgonamonadaceae bacterium]
MAAVLICSCTQKAGFYSFTVEANDGTDFQLKSLKGKKVMVVNVASQCGLTPQYKQLQALYDKYKDRNFTIIAFPANNFGAQEPGTNEEIMQFCTLNYGVTFPVMAKISVKDDDISPLYQWLTSQKEEGKEVQWNFQKYLIDRNGNVVKVLAPNILPDDEFVINWLEEK